MAEGLIPGMTPPVTAVSAVIMKYWLARADA